MRPTFLVSLGVAGLATLMGCAQVPSQELDAAKRSMDAATTAQAREYAPDAWRAASDAQTQLDAELSAQEERNALFRSYGTTKRLASEVKQAADRAANEAAAGKQQAKDEATKLMADANDAIDRARKDLESAPRGKGTEVDLASLKSDAGTAGTTLREMQATFDAGDYNGAKAKAQAVISAAEQIEKEIEKARSMRRGEKHA